MYTTSKFIKSEKRRLYRLVGLHFDINAVKSNAVSLLQHLLLLINEPPHDKSNKMACVPIQASDRPGHPSSLIWVFAVHSICSSGPKLSSCGQSWLWSDWANAQADRSLCWAHMPFCWFCHEAAQICHLSSNNECLCTFLCKHIFNMT